MKIVNLGEKLSRALSAHQTRADASACPIHQLNARKTSKDELLKPYKDIPRKNRLIPAPIGLMLSGGPSYLHKHCEKRHEQLGPIYRERLGSIELVFVADTKMIRTVFANEGVYPHHNVPEAWLLYNKVRGVERGIFFQTGTSWLKLRKCFNKVMLADVGSAKKFTGQMMQVCDDLFASWLRLAPQTQNGQLLIHDLKLQLCRWSIETTGVALFGDRLGCVTNSKTAHLDNSKPNCLVENVTAMFEESSRFQLLPVRMAQKINLPTWQRFVQASDTMLQIANDYVRDNIQRCKIRDSKHTSLVQDLLKLNLLNEEEIGRTIVDLVIAAADTTSNSLQWMLYALARHKDVQDKLRSEIDLLFANINSQHSNETYENLRETAPFLSAFMKESQRLFPTAPFLARTLDRDIALGQYRVPAGIPIVFSVFATSRMSKYFEEPLIFKPERWMRNKNKSQARPDIKHAYASLPFGLGSRMCLGRRVAELEMSLFIATIVRKFVISLENQSEDVEIKLKMILEPSKPINLLLQRRH